MEQKKGNDLVQPKVKMQAAIDGHSGKINCLCCLTGEGEFVVTGSDDWTVRIWDLETRECTAVLRGHSAPVLSLTALKDGTFASGSFDKSIRVYDLRPNSKRPCTVLDKHQGPVLCLAALDIGEESTTNGMLISGSQDQTIKIWDPVDDKLQHTFEGQNCPVGCLISLDAKHVASASQESTNIIIWDCAKLQFETSLGARGHRVTSLAVQGALLASGSKDTTVKIWNWQSHIQIMNLESHKTAVLDVAFLPSGYLVTTALNESLMVWDVERGQSEGYSVNSSSNKPPVSNCLGAHPSGKLVSGSGDNKLRLYAVEVPLTHLALGCRHEMPKSTVEIP
eukprot:gnl/MRDRNA2_/MRDRNA2_16153_c0_seq1.p1 gnl/MRDRNA2_/MRDRNA2_16153_c0~~gnl/MRDRNA2_/MRDRNA2_16153_c0_seq1.p1  ORF type:complete len:337 (+),score=42.41 gnl/MRDRNA2_/MRDRNA2_16153_c0_seq1:245-1255(+)